MTTEIQYKYNFTTFCFVYADVEHLSSILIQKKKKKSREHVTS